MDAAHAQQLVRMAQASECQVLVALGADLDKEATDIFDQHRIPWHKTVSRAAVAAAALNEFFQRTSYGKVSLDFTVLPEIDMGVSYTNYNAPYGTTGLTKFAAWDQPGSLGDDARAKARLAGVSAGQAARYDSGNYDFDIIVGGFILWRMLFRRPSRKITGT